jgi:RNA polymerase sigma factor (sigma-70 family)
MSKQLSIIIADDHPVVLHGLAAILGAHTDFDVVALCADGASALDAIRRMAPDIAILDIAMPKPDGLDILSHFDPLRCGTRFVILTATASDGQILGLIAGGAKGILLKYSAARDLVHCVREIGNGGCWFPSELVNKALERETGRRIVQERVTQDLTAREREVMLLVAQGLSNKEIGRRLNLAEGTVKIHLHNIYDKLQVRKRSALTAVALTHHQSLVS